MIGMVQYVAYLIAAYMAYRGLSDALRDIAEIHDRPAWVTALRILCALMAIALFTATFVLLRGMERLATGLANG